MVSTIRSGDGVRTEVGASRLEQAIETIRRATRKRNEVPKEDLSEAVDDLSQYSSIRGLEDESLSALIDILTTPGKLDQGSTAAIINSLYPRNKVPEGIAVKVVGCFGQGQSKPSLQVQALLLRWLVMIYNVLQGYTMLSQLYGILFNLLDMITLRAHLCHLLSFLTRRRHVKPFRIQALLELKRIVGNEQPLLGLLQIYKDYYPDVIVERLASTKSGVFSHPNAAWMETLLVIQDANASNGQAVLEKSSFQIVRKHGGKRRKTDHLTVPEVRTYRAVESSVTLEEIANVDDFVARLDKLELPNQLAAAIEDPLLQRLLDLKLSEADQRRINNWLAAYLSCGVGDAATEYLKKLLSYTKYTKRLLPAIEEYLEACLKTNRHFFQLDYVMELLTFLPFRSFKELHTRFLQPLDKLFNLSDASASSKLIGFYSGLLRHWISDHFMPPHESALPPDADGIIIHYMRHVSSIVVHSLQGNKPSNHACNSALTFYEVAVSFPVEISPFRLVLPPDILVFHSLFAGDAFSLSRLCGILSKYKRNAEETRKLALSSQSNGLEPYPKPFIDHLNGLVMDVCNCVWLNKGFSRAENSLGCHLSKELGEKLNAIAISRGEDLRLLYSLTRSTALARFSGNTFASLEDRERVNTANRHRGPLTQDSLKNLAAAGGLKIPWREFKKEILKDLQQQGFTGISELMYEVIPAISSG